MRELSKLYIKSDIKARNVVINLFRFNIETLSLFELEDHGESLPSRSRNSIRVTSLDRDPVCSSAGYGRLMQ